jgi:8-oxo-dGTP pyrophosphatase MutT (NUDIX family)
MTPPKPWKIVSSLLERRFRIFNIRTDAAVSPRTGKTHEFFILESAPWVNVIPLTAAEEVVLIRQYRHGIRQNTLEIPGGLVDPGDTPDRAALRELREETGYSGDYAKHIGTVHPNPAILDNRCHSYVVTGAQPTETQSMDEKEDIEVLLRPLGDIPGLIADGSIDHALVLCAFLYFFQKERPELLAACGAGT